MFTHMTPAQKTSIAIGAAVIFLMLIFPPFHIQIEGHSLSMGYGFILVPPETGYTIPPAVNIPMLLTQWMGVLILTALAYFFFMESRQFDDKSNAANSNCSPQDKFNLESGINESAEIPEESSLLDVNPRASQESREAEFVSEEMKVEQSDSHITPPDQTEPQTVQRGSTNNRNIRQIIIAAAIFAAIEILISTLSLPGYPFLTIAAGSIFIAIAVAAGSYLATTIVAEGVKAFGGTLRFEIPSAAKKLVIAIFSVMIIFHIIGILSMRIA